MLNIGLIGNTKKLEPHVKQFQKNKSINIIGKSSVGGDNKFSSFHFSVPEFNRIELIERADIIILDNSSAYPFNLISDILKKSKHIYVTEYIDLNINECTELVKLSNEAGSVIQFTNPFFFTPAICWLKQNLGKPFFFNISYLNAAFSQDNLFQLLLMLIEISGISPKKIEAISFQLEQSGSRFNNVRLEFGDASVLNLNYGNHDLIEEFKIEAFSPKKFIKLNFKEKNYVCNKKPIDLDEFALVNEFDAFTNATKLKSKTISSIEDYLIALRMVQKIDKKISQFSE